MAEGGETVSQLGRNGLHRRPLRRILTAMLLHQSNGTLTDFRRKFVVLAHGSIFSKVGASSKLDAIQVTDIVNSAKLTVGQIFSCPTVQHFQFELLRVSAALTHETVTAMVLVCRHPTSDEAVSDAVFGCEDFVSPFAREVVPNH